MSMKRQVKVKPNAKVSQILEAEDGSLIAQLRSPPVGERLTRS